MKNIVFCFVVLLGLVQEGKSGFGDGEQAWGYVQLHENSKMFWWLYYTTADVDIFTERPLIVVVNGGTGPSSGWSNFAEVGPLDLDLNPRNHTWVKNANVLFIDAPVGTGFSEFFHDNIEEIWFNGTNSSETGSDLVNVMKRFYDEIPSFKTVPMYIIAENYAGWYIGEFVLQLDAAISAGKIASNFKGIGLAGAWMSFRDMLNNWAKYLLQLGLIDQQGFIGLSAAIENCSGNDCHDLGDYVWSTDILFTFDVFNVIDKIPSAVDGSGLFMLNYYAKYEKLETIMNSYVKPALNLSTIFDTIPGVIWSIQNLSGTSPDYVERILNETNIDVVVFNGQLDSIVPITSTVQWVDALKWVRRDDWQTAPREAIVVDGIIEGFSKEVERLGLYWVNRSGYQILGDNPAAIDWILRKLTKDFSDQ